MAVEMTPLVCPVCAKEDKRVPLVKINSFYAHGEGQRGRACHVVVFTAAVLETLAPPKAAEAKR